LGDRIKKAAESPRRPVMYDPLQAGLPLLWLILETAVCAFT
jgi:hypothetical protein